MNARAPLPSGQSVWFDDPSPEERAVLDRALAGLRAGGYVRDLMRTGSVRLIADRRSDPSLPPICAAGRAVAMLGEADPASFVLALMEAPEASTSLVGLARGLLRHAMGSASDEGTHDRLRMLARCPSGAAGLEVSRRRAPPGLDFEIVPHDPSLDALAPRIAQVAASLPDPDDDDPAARPQVLVSPLAETLIGGGAPDALEALRIMTALRDRLDVAGRKDDERMGHAP